MSERIVVRYQITFDSLMAAQRAFRRGTLTRVLRIATWVAFLVLVALRVIVTLSVGRVDWASVAFLLVLGLVLWLLPYFERLRHRAIYRRMPVCDTEVGWVFTRKGIHQESVIGVEDLKWEAFIKVQEHRDLFLLFPQPNIYYWLPNTAFENDAAVAAFAELAREKVSDYRVVK